MPKKLVTKQPISLLDGINRETGEIIDKNHDLFGQSIAGVDLSFPKSSGSTVGVMTLIELKQIDKAPASITLEEPDTNVIAGCILANIPVFIKNQPPKLVPVEEARKLSGLPQFLQDLLIKEAEILGAEGFIPIQRVQVAGVSYKTIGDGGIKVLEYFAKKNLKFKVPTTLNPAGMDLEHWKKQGIPEAFARKQQYIIELFKKMGAEVSVSCIPYDLHYLESGAHVAFGESSAVSYANSALNVITNRENAVKTLISALTGFTTKIGMHIKENRVPDVQINVKCELKTRADYGALGYFAGRNANSPYFVGISPNTSQTKAIAAAGAASGSIALFFAENISSSIFWYQDNIKNTIDFTEKELKTVYDELNTTSEEPELISIGCPHLNWSELVQFLRLIERKKFKIPVWVSTAKQFKEDLEKNKLILKNLKIDSLEDLEKSNIFIYSDCCVVVSPVELIGYKIIGTDSAKAAKYLPLMSKCDVVFKSIEDFVKLYGIKK